jgi:hypothetical protein
MIIAQSCLSNGKCVSTMSLCTGGYETLVFPDSNICNVEVDGERYDTYEEAEQGHINMCRKHGREV